VIRGPVSRAVLAALLAGVPAAAQQADSAAPRPRLVEHEASVRLRPRLSTSSVPGAEPVRWEYARVRLQGRVTVAGRVAGRLQLDVEGDEWSVDDAWLQLRLAESVELLLGQAKRPFTVLSMRGGSQVGTVSRGASLRGTDALDEQEMVDGLGFGGRAAGVQVSAPVPFAPASLRVAAGLFPARPWKAPLAAGGLQASVRATAELAPGVAVGAAWSARRGGGTDPEAPPPGSALGVDVELGGDEPGLHLLAEAVAGSVEGAGGGFRGAHVWLMYRTREHGRPRITLEPVLRWSASGGSVPDGALGTLATPGLNVYVGDPGRWNRLMVNLDVWNPRGAGPATRSLKVQLQLGV
jgi:hypothetical protein